MTPSLNQALQAAVGAYRRACDNTFKKSFKKLLTPFARFEKVPPHTEINIQKQ
jgi:hypothetical protein